MAGYNTPGLPLITAANLTGSEQLAMDTEYANGTSPQSAAVTTADLATFASGGAAGAGVAVAGAVTITSAKAKITTEALTTAAGAVYTLTITDPSITAASFVLASVDNGTSTTGTACVTTVHPAAGSLVIKIQNIHASAAFNGTLVISFRAT